eukprot:13390221-Alexandrium_andersonii.AAC.1
MAADEGRAADAPSLVPPMPARPVHDDDDTLVRRAVEGRPPQPRPYEGQLPPGMEGVTGPLPPSRPLPPAGQAASSAEQAP